jgi:hypothetical protein
MRLEVNPLDGRADYAVSLKTAPLDLVYNRELIHLIGKLDR